MAGTKLGGKKVAIANKAKDPDYYIKLGAMGGSTPTSKPKGFARNPGAASIYGRKGGLASGYKQKKRAIV
jgi:general stress protein YciG